RCSRLWEGRKSTGTTHGRAFIESRRNSRASRCSRCFSHCHLSSSYFNHAGTPASDGVMRLNRVVSSRLAFVVAGILLLAIPALSQQAATITYTQDFPGSDPSHYVISVSSDGHAHYEGNGRLITTSKYSTDDSVPDTEQLDFTASKATVDKIFDLAK